MAAFAILYLLLTFGGGQCVAAQFVASYITSTKAPRNDSAESDNACEGRSIISIPYLVSWMESARPARGCSVPYIGPLGHGQHPEEVHVIRVVDGERWSTKQPEPVVTLMLDSAACPQQYSNNGSRPDTVSSLPMVNRHKRDALIKLHRTHRVAEELNVEPSSLPVPSRKIREVEINHPPAAMIALLGQGIVQIDRRKLWSNFSAVSERPLVLLLTSDQPLKWQLRQGDCWSKTVVSKVQAMVNKGSTIEANFPIEAYQKTWVNKVNRKSIQRYIRRTYHGVASYTQVQGINSVRIFVGRGGPADKKADRWRAGRVRNKPNLCDFNSRQESLTVSASLKTLIAAKGCTYGEMKGQPANALVVEVEALSAASKLSKKLVGSTSMKESKTKWQRNLPSIEVTLEGFDTKQRYPSRNSSLDDDGSNMTIVLRSTQPVRWLLQTENFSGSNVIVVDRNDKVLNSKAGKGSDIQVLSWALPKSTSELMSSVTKEFGSPVLYTHTGRISGLTLNMSKKTTLGTDDRHPLNTPIPPPMSHVEKLPQGKKMDTTVWEPKQYPSNFQLPPWSIVRQPQSGMHLHRTNIPAIGADNRQEQLSKLKSNMTIFCGKSHVELSFPTQVVTELGIKSLYLNDQSCQSSINRTHVSLVTLITSCGSTSHTVGKTTAFSNYVHVKFVSTNEDDDDSDGSGQSTQSTDDVEYSTSSEDEADNRFPIICRYETGDNEDVEMGSDDTLAEDDDLVGSNNVHLSHKNPPTLYQLDLFHESTFPIEHLLLRSSDRESRVVAKLNERVYVQAWMNGAASVRVVMETCWINNKTHAEDGQGIILLSNLCPLTKTVKLELPTSGVSSQHSTSAIFSFEVLEEHSKLGEELYVHCRVGVCALSSRHTRGNLALCVDGSLLCPSHAHAPHSIDRSIVPAAQQWVSQGPIIITPSAQATAGRVPFPSKPEGVAVITSWTSTEIGATVTAEMAAGIAVCSFMIGAGLMAALWFIHAKTDPHRHQHRCQMGEHSIGSRSAVTGSSLSPHSGCSSTNSQTGIA